jgi:ABC-type sugar transport system ATPase subunit
LKVHGVAQVIISHRLNDIFEIGDRVMALKRGRNVGDRAIAETNEKEVLELIVSGAPETLAAAGACALRGDSRAKEGHGCDPRPSRIRSSQALSCILSTGSPSAERRDET